MCPTVTEDRARFSISCALWRGSQETIVIETALVEPIGTLFHKFCSVAGASVAGPVRALDITPPQGERRRFLVTVRDLWALGGVGKAGLEAGSRVLMLMREDLPQCELCGVYYCTNGELATHQDSAHPELALREVSLRAAIDDKIECLRKPDLTHRIWGHCALLCAADRMDDAHSLLRKSETFKGLRLLLMQCYPSARLHTFGSTTTGIGSRFGDIDIAADLGLSSSVDEAAVIAGIARRWRRLHPFKDLKAVTGSRVPVLVHTPPLEATQQWNKAPAASRSISFLVPPDSLPPFTKALGSCEGMGLGVENVALGEDRLIVEFRTQLASIGGRLLLERVQGVPRGRRPPKWVGESTMDLPAVYLSKWDLSLRMQGVQNTRLVKAYLQPSPLLRIACFAVKSWAKRAGVSSNPQGGGLTSYAVTVLFIYYCLRKGHLAWIAPESVPVSETREFALPPVDLPAHFDSSEKATELGEVVVGFFQFYGQEFDWETEVVSLRLDPKDASALRKEDLGWTRENEVRRARGQSTFYAICVEDPYESLDGRRLNLGRNLTAVGGLEVVCTFRMGLRRLMDTKGASAAFFMDDGGSCSNCGIRFRGNDDGHIDACHACLEGHAGNLYCRRCRPSERLDLGADTSTVVSLISKTGCRALARGWLLQQSQCTVFPGVFGTAH
eukprot:Hpha_TRINITY_DN16676_c1_g2::TRINITY_DN16676_c1_g2_i3::g.182827::m.182827